MFFICLLYTSPFAKIRQLALAEHLGEDTASLLSEPNNILGVSYCQLLERLESSIQPRTIRRLGAGYHEAELQEHQAFPSATPVSYTHLEALVQCLTVRDFRNTAKLAENVFLSAMPLEEVLAIRQRMLDSGAARCV